MANKQVLAAAIKKLEDVNRRLRIKRRMASDKHIRQYIDDTITKNKAMIIDYQYRMNYE